MKIATMVVLVAGVAILAAGKGEAAGDADGEYRALLEAWKGGQYLRALEMAEGFLAAHPKYKYTPAVLYIGGNSGLISKRYERAEKLYRGLIDRFPDYKRVDNAANELVTALSRARKLTECIAQCDANIEADPEAKLVHRWVYMKAECRFRMWEFEAAKAALTEFLKLYPDSSLKSRAQYYLDRIEPDWETDEHRIVKGYAGKYVKDVRFEKAVASVPEAIDYAFGILKARLGVDLRGKTDFVVQFEDAGRKAGYRGDTWTVCRGTKTVEVIRFYTEYVVLSLPEFRLRLVHEMKHAGFRGILGQAYLQLPRWVREGLAVYAEDQYEIRAAHILGNRMFSGGDPFDVVDPIEDPDRDTDDYLADVLAFEWLERRKSGNVAAFCRRLLAGEDYRKIYAELAEMPLEKALAEAERFAKAWVRELLGKPYEEYRVIREASFAAAQESREARKVWLETGGRGRLELWLKTHAGHCMEPNVRYRLGKECVIAGDYETGRTWLRRVVDEDFERSSICDDALYWMAWSFATEGKAEEAREAYGVLLRDYCWSTPVLKKVKGDWKAAGPVTR